MFKHGDLVTLKKNFYDLEQFQQLKRAHRIDIARQTGKVLRVVRKHYSGFVAYKVVEGEQPCGCGAIPQEILMPVEKEKVETSFSVGDKVIVTGGTAYHRFDVGTVGEIREVSDSKLIACVSRKDGATQLINIGHLKAYQPPTKKKWTDVEINLANSFSRHIIWDLFEKGFGFNFLENAKDGTIRVYVKKQFSIVNSAVAKCSPNDEFNLSIGKCVALCKAMKRNIPDFIKGGE